MSANGHTATQLVLGSLERGEEYQRIVTELKSNGGIVQAEMVDRVLDGGELTRAASADGSHDIAATTLDCPPRSSSAPSSEPFTSNSALHAIIHTLARPTPATGSSDSVALLPFIRRLLSPSTNPFIRRHRIHLTLFSLGSSPCPIVFGFCPTPFHEA